MRHIKILSFFLLTALIFFKSSYSQADRSDFKLIVFGDSLVDVGNNPTITSLLQLQNGSLVPGFVVPPPTRYDRGRFSNGPVIVDYLALRLGIFLKPTETGFDLNTDSVSYAYGGAQTGTENLTPGGFPVLGLTGQVDKFSQDLDSSDANISNTTFLIWVGANDYLNAPNPDNSSITGNILQSVEDLSQLGAKKIIVVNLPNLGKLPFCAPLNLCEQFTELTNKHNRMLSEGLDSFKKSHRSTKITLFNAHKIFEQLFANPSKYGFANDLSAGAAKGCLFQPPSTFSFDNCNIVNFVSKNIFWDEVHPSTRVHKILAKELFYKLISND
jgi:phospholipase/lecithinase/hemolysin